MASGEEELLEFETQEHGWWLLQKVPLQQQRQQQALAGYHRIRSSLQLWGTFWIQLCLQTCHCFWLGSAKDACASILADMVEYDPAFEQFELWDLAFEALTTLLHEFGQRHHLDASLIEEIGLEALH